MGGGGDRISEELVIFMWFREIEGRLSVVDFCGCLGNEPTKQIYLFETRKALLSLPHITCSFTCL